MKFLIYNDKLDDLTNIIKTLRLDLKIDTVDDYDGFFHHYNNNNYDVIIINYFSNVWNKLLNNVIDKDNNQNIILLSESYECSQNNNCLSCQENYNVNISIKPILESEIVNLLSKSLPCEEYKKSNLEFDLLKISKKINKQYQSIFIDLDKLTFTFNNIVSDNKKIVILTDLVYELKNENIEYIVEENFNIKIIQ